jgi:hypothetical protein
MTRAGPWLLRLGAALILVAPFLPQCSTGSASLGPLTLPRPSNPAMPPMLRLAIDAGLFLPVLAGALILAGGWRKGGGPAALRVATLGLLLAVSFGLATLGSLLFTEASSRTANPSFPLSVGLFAVPLALSGIALSRWMEGGVERSTGAFERASLGLLMLLHGLFLADFGWDALMAAGVVQKGTIRLLPGAWLGPLGGLLAAAGVVLSSLPPRAAVDTAAASG